ncbi:6-phosphofructo-2-kinase-domain-containing protein [Multifurca ochricompacta]|uniref:6-phosphofructo-2-kinase-domain-containing protein n=1 Tax=Multifurca ochricompacta TaxID=376703 RepID=A0AAD4M1G0_9AGAM|nr:6-phosphofructo-2-kinase-domain-containing protein [Multifurca ochricompacta]
MVAPLYTTASGLLFHAGKILVVTVGLPARGKTHISRALERYLRWAGIKTQVVSLGDYRRKSLGDAQKLPPDYFTFGKKSPETLELRQKVLDGCEELIWEFFNAGGQCVIYDANNGRREQRQRVAEKFGKEGIHVVILESTCDDPAVIERNIRSVKISSPDYRSWDPDLAVQDYYNRIRDHEIHYETVDELDVPSIRIVNNVRGYLQSRIIFFLMNIHNRYRTIYFARIDPDLSDIGWDYAERLKDFVLEHRGLDPRTSRLVIWTSARRRSHHTAWPFMVAADPKQPGGPQCNVKVIERPQMSEINPGVWDGLTVPDAKREYPEEWGRFVKDPYTFRAPRAESYHDLSVRLEPTLIELEREQEDLLIIGHASVIRCLLAYLIGLPPSEIPAIEVARGDLIEVVPASYGVHSQAYHFWDGPGRTHGEGEGGYEERDPNNFYENYAEDTREKKHRVGYRDDAK